MSAVPVEAEKGNAPRSRKGAATRARLVEAAKAVFEDVGFLDARVSDIADRAGLSHGSFYHYFDSKEQVFREVAQAIDRELSAGMALILDRESTASPQERLTAALRLHFEGYRREARMMRVIEQMSRHDEEVRQIVERNYDPGSLVGPGDKPVVVVADLRVMTLQAGVSELEAGRLRVGMPARVTTQAHPGQVFEGRVAAIAPEIDARNRHFRIEVRIPNPGGPLLSGMYGDATIPLARAAQVIAVPREAVTTRGGRRVALRIDSDTVNEVPVTEGMTDGRLVQIASGLQAGDVIVSDARQDAAVGAKVNPILK